MFSVSGGRHKAIRRDVLAGPILTTAISLMMSRLRSSGKAGSFQDLTASGPAISLAAFGFACAAARAGQRVTSAPARAY